MKNFLLFSIIVFFSACTKDVVPTIPEEIIKYDIALLEIFGSWELLNSGPMSCPNDVYTFNEDATFNIDLNHDCGDFIPSDMNVFGNWTATENSFSLGLLYGTHIIISKDETNMQTSIIDGEILNWKKSQ